MFQQDIEIAMTEKKLFLLHVQLYGFHLCWFLVAIVCRKTETYGTNDTTDKEIAQRNALERHVPVSSMLKHVNLQDTWDFVLYTYKMTFQKPMQISITCMCRRGQVGVQSTYSAFSIR